MQPKSLTSKEEIQCWSREHPTKSNENAGSSAADWVHHDGHPFVIGERRYICCNSVNVCGGSKAMPRHSSYAGGNPSIAFMTSNSSLLSWTTLGWLDGKDDRCQFSRSWWPKNCLAPKDFHGEGLSRLVFLTVNDLYNLALDHYRFIGRRRYMVQEPRQSLCYSFPSLITKGGLTFVRRSIAGGTRSLMCFTWRIFAVTWLK